ncbi:MAG TPA: RNA-binding protein [Methylocella sp.]
MVDILTGQVEDREPTPEQLGKDPAAVARGKLGGVKGGSARAANMTAKQRSDSARNAARKRWGQKSLQD